MGWLLLGPRPDNSLYGKDEREALCDIADPLARAVRIVLLREERQAQEQSWQQQFEERFAQLEAMLARLTRSRPASAAE